jgi:disease resistance protein RPS2
LQSDKDCLVVLDDVWSVNDVAVFDHLSGKCQLLITTRDAEVVRGSRGFVYELQFMAQDKSRSLLYQSAGVEPDELSKFSPKMHQIVEGLLNQCRGLPLALSLVGSNLIDTRLQQDWQDVLEDLQNADLEQLHSQFPAVSYPYDNVLAAIDTSFQRLKKSEQEQFLDFGIFPEDINIPSDILELFWSSEGAGRTSCIPREGRRILNALERKSLIQKGTWGGGGGGSIHNKMARIFF